MEINNIKKVSMEGSRMKGIASVKLDNGKLINDIRIIEGKNDLFIAVPMPKFFSGKVYEEMDNDEKNMYDGYLKSIEGIDELVLEEFRNL